MRELVLNFFMRELGVNVHLAPPGLQARRAIEEPPTPVRTALRPLLLWLLLSGLVGLFFSPALRGASVTLAWDSNSEPDLAGYKLYYGTASGSYAESNKVGNVLTATITHLTAGATYFFAVTAYDTNEAESDFSNEVSYAPPQTPPTITGLADQIISANTNTLKLAFQVTDRETPAYSLKLSAISSNPTLIPASGIVFSGYAKNRTVRITPATNQSGRAGITIVVTDEGLPALSATTTFTVFVGGYLELSLGTAIVLAGQQGRVAIAVNAATPITSVAFTVDALAPGLTDLGLESPMPSLASAIFYRRSPSRFHVKLGSRADQPFYGTQALVSLRFQAMDNGPSAFIPLRLSEISAFQPQIVPVGLVEGHDGRVVFINRAPLLEAQMESARYRLLLYAPPALIHTLQCAPSLTPPIAWSTAWSGPVTNLVQVLEPPPCGTSSFYRVIAP